MPFDPEAMVRMILAALPCLPLSLLLAILPILLGLPLAFLIALPQYFGSRLAWLARGWITLVRATPLVLILLLSYFLLQAGIDRTSASLHLGFRASSVPLTAIIVLAFTVGTSSALSEAVRAALLSLAPGQLDAAYAIGMTRAQALRRIVIPQAIPVLAPQLGNIFIGCFKATSIAYLVSVTDVLNAATMEAARTYQYAEAYAAAAAIYWTVCLVAGRLTALAEAVARRLFWGEVVSRRGAQFGTGTMIARLMSSEALR